MHSRVLGSEEGEQARDVPVNFGVPQGPATPTQMSTERGGKGPAAGLCLWSPRASLVCAFKCAVEMISQGAQGRSNWQGCRLLITCRYMPQVKIFRNVY
ncbi:hypothetical protein TNIN_9101 [Trichonephila inaurata madagascariensis]|uniref:Uncharacterized protein n=1 Tax=Trichonephila inaurata madagascariensis TaxID=2747483 RepID=A0A8X6J2K9_9ARAC|nr:hypothetical protein TNIN_9101 [Trichonephila inaurata madagascariensis]